MTIKEKFLEVANIELVEYNGDLEIGTLMTADSYEVFYMTGDIRNLQYDSELFYYKPSFDDIMSTIKDWSNGSVPVEVTIYDFEDYIEEYEMIDWLNENMDELEFEELMDQFPS